MSNQENGQIRCRFCSEEIYDSVTWPGTWLHVGTKRDQCTSDILGPKAEAEATMIEGANHERIMVPLNGAQLWRDIRGAILPLVLLILLILAVTNFDWWFDPLFPPIQKVPQVPTRWWKP